jgi:hypothetical protein
MQVIHFTHRTKTVLYKWSSFQRKYQRELLADPMLYDTTRHIIYRK